jgi:hypothetical protein
MSPSARALHQAFNEASTSMLYFAHAGIHFTSETLPDNIERIRVLVLLFSWVNPAINCHSS